MRYHEVKRKTSQKKHVQVGRGGKRGKTSGKGHKGQKARAGSKIRPEIRDMIKKLPKLRGRGVNSNTPKADPEKTVTLELIDANFKNSERVTPKVLFEKGILRKTKGKLPTVKIVATGEFTKKLQFRNVYFSANARKIVEEAGGKIL
jgi:large subunit ribosomal protein L15